MSRVIVCDRCSRIEYTELCASCTIALIKWLEPLNKQTDQKAMETP